MTYIINVFDILGAKLLKNNEKWFVIMKKM